MILNAFLEVLGYDIKIPSIDDHVAAPKPKGTCFKQVEAFRNFDHHDATPRSWESAWGLASF